MGIDEFNNDNFDHSGLGFVGGGSTRVTPIDSRPVLPGTPAWGYATSMIRVVLAGSRAGATDAAPTAPAMPSFGWNLSDDNVADVLTYVRNSWGNAAPAVFRGDVRKLRKEMLAQ